MKYGRNVFLWLFVICLTSCSSFYRPVTEIQVQSFDVAQKGIRIDVAFNKASGILVDRGFDVKMINKDIGIITTEYKKFASSGEKPPFDYFMQLKIKIRADAKGKTVVQISPIIKEQNRLNIGAFSEHELVYYTGDPENVRLIEGMREGVGWQSLGHILFMNVVSDVAEAFGLTIDGVIQNVTSTPKTVFKIF